MKIYTKTGDNGETGMMGGKRLRKDSPRIQAQGDIDELNAALGVCRAYYDESFGGHWAHNGEKLVRDEGHPGEKIREPHAPIGELLEGILHILQKEIFVLGADISTPLDTQHKVPRIEEKQVMQLENWIDEMELQLEPLRHFILPGGSVVAANLHLARTICRRAERSVVSLSQKENINAVAIIYMNRLSDLLFVMARLANKMVGVEEEKWQG